MEDSMKAPSEKRLREAFPDTNVKQLRAIIRNEIEPDTVPEVSDWIRQCYNRPRRHELKMAAINALIGGHGVEAIFAPGSSERVLASYVNTGDTYSATILHHKSYQLTTWGDWVETWEKRHKRLD
jgi:hypothetical protein